MRHIIYDISGEDDIESVKEKYYADYEKIISDKFFLFNSRDEVKRFLSHSKISGGNI